LLCPPKRARAEWRQALGLTEPSRQLDEALESMAKAVHAASQPGNVRTLELATALRADVPREQELDGLVRRVLLAMIEERGTRQPRRS
jgi:hypothetical protein